MTTATVNYSVPAELKDEFNHIFSKRNKSQIIAEYMQKAIDDYKAQKQRKKSIAKLKRIRSKLEPISQKALSLELKKGRK